jgi:thiamine biosynthesis lipoprotein
MTRELRARFDCFGGTVEVRVAGRSERADAAPALARARALLLDAHRRLSRFLPESELTLLNDDPRHTVPASPLLVELAAAVRRAGLQSCGLVDATLLDEIEALGYSDSMGSRAEATIPGPPAAVGAASAKPRGGWELVQVDRVAGTISRPPGVRIDSGGIAKGLLADLVGASLRGHATYAVDCCGDMRLGGTAGAKRTILVEDPFGGDPIYELALTGGGVATSGIGRRAWVGPDRQPAHHLVDPGTGRPAFTGIVQATALAPTAFLAEVLAKQALLSGPERAAACLQFGGVVVSEDGAVDIVERSHPGELMAAAP